jgi:ABC-type uncharacterized transport system fused permease/ATPase subunit
VILANAAAQIGLTFWQGASYGALQRRDLPAVARELLTFAPVAGTLLALVVAQTWLQETAKVALREWLTRDLLDEWLAPRRAALLTFAGPVGANPDQRLHEDARHPAELSADLGVGLLRASLLLASFVGVLWALSGQVGFGIGGHRFVLPGYTVWCALAYASLGSWLTWRVGRPLVRLNGERHAREAELRFELVRAGGAAEGIALYGGEREERLRLDRAGRIELAEQVGGSVRLEDLSVCLADGRARLDPPRAEVRPRERVLVAGVPGSGKSTLFRAMAGLWPCGAGRILMPPRATVLFMPRRPCRPPFSRAGGRLRRGRGGRRVGRPP